MSAPEGARSAPDGVGLHRRGVAAASSTPSASFSRRRQAARPSRARRPRRHGRAGAARRCVASPTLRLDHQVAGPRVARIEGGGEVPGVEQRQVDRLLQVEAVMHPAQEQRQLPLVLLVAARRAEDQRRARHPSAPATASAWCAGACRARGSSAGPGSSQNICAREFSGKPSSGMTGEDCSQPPDGVAEIMLPCRSMTSICTVSPRLAVFEMRHGRLAGRRRRCPGAGGARRFSSVWRDLLLEAGQDRPGAARATPCRR